MPRAGTGRAWELIMATRAPSRLAAGVLVSSLVACGDPGAVTSSDEVVGGAAAERVASHCVIAEGDRCRMVEPRDVATFASGAVQMPGFTYLANGALAALGTRSSDRRIVSSTSADLVSFTPVETLPWLAADVGGRKTLYFTSRIDATVGLFASALEGLVVHPPVPVTLEGSPVVVPYWPQAVGLEDGRTLLGFVEPQKRAFLAVDDGSGTRFRVGPWPNVSGDLRGVLAHVGTTASGAWVITHQSANADWRFSSFVQISTDEGASWSSPRNVEPNDPDVHDAFPIARADAGADLYYLHMAGPGEFVVHRRALHEDGTLGPAEQVTSGAVGHIEKPQPRRLPDGRIALSFAARRPGEVYDLAIAYLAGDAPP